jgi:hypothetical protein
MAWCKSNGQTTYETSDTTGLQLQSQDRIVQVSLSGFKENLDSLRNNGSNLSFSQHIHENSHSMEAINDDLDV